MRKILLAGLVIALLSAGWAPTAEAGQCGIGCGVASFAAARAEGVKRRHDRRVERRQSGRGLAKALPRNW